MKEDILASLKEEIDAHKPLLKKISDGIINGDISMFPIFVATQTMYDIGLGLPITNPAEIDSDWQINASHLEDFVNKKILSPAKVEDFMKNFKNPSEFVCVFLAEEESGFVFIPYASSKPNFNIENLN